MRELKASDEIQTEVNCVANALIEKGGASDRVMVGGAKLLLEPDANGCNWYLDFLGNHHIAQIGAALRDVKARWNLHAP